MAGIGVKLEMNPDLIGKLNTERALWAAAHDDGSGSRINADTVLEAGSYGVSIGVFAALLMWIRKKFRNRGKTKEDLAAEKEAAKTNRTCTALEAMLLEYIRSAQDGVLDEETLDDLIGTLEEMHGYDQAGKLRLPDREALTGMRSSIAQFTAAILEKRGAQPVRNEERTGTDEFALIRDQLILQRSLIRSEP